MRNPISALAAILLAAGWCASAQVAPARRNVIVISLDGFSAYALADPKSPVRTLRKLIEQGTSARRMTTVNPTITWPNHTAIVTGVDASRNGLLVNGKITRTGVWPPVKVEQWIPKEQMVHATTVYDVAHRAGLTTAQVNWVAIKSAPTIDWEFPEIPSTDGRIEGEMIARHLVDAATVGQYSRVDNSLRDEIFTDAVIHILREHHPNLLICHLGSIDHVAHTYGPGSLAAATAMAFVDTQVARIVDAIQALGLRENTVLLVVSDHGFKAVKNDINIAAAIASAGLSDKVYGLAFGGYALLYVKPDGAVETIAKLRTKLSLVDGVAEIAGPERYPALGLPDPSNDPQMGDLVLFPKSGYEFTSGKIGPVSAPVTPPVGAHGYINSDPEMDAIFIAFGAGIHAGVAIDRISNMDVAPTVAALLGIRMPAHLQGHDLTEILSH
jgi:predicted AlkP superfamily pyrophosphatase or phosphodiesterase